VRDRTEPSEERLAAARTLGEGPFVAGGVPVRKRLPDREIDLYAIRSFSAFLHPNRDLALLLSPPGPSDVLVSRMDDR
jgi:hypothetical protein